MQPHFRSAGYICFLCNGEIQDPISKPCGHSFCLNCLYKYRALKGNVGGGCPSCINRKGINKETTDRFDLGAEDEILEGFAWKPGPGTVTNGIWIWSKPFILELNEQKIAVFLMGMEGSMDIYVDRKSNIKMCMLTMLLSLHLVYNVSSTIKETDIDYLEIYCHGLGSDKLHKLKYFDFLIRNWYDPRMCGAEHGESHYKLIIETMKKKYKDCTFLEVLNQCSSKCFLMPYPGEKITSEDTGRLKDMNKEFQESLRIYLSGVVRRVLSSIGSANSENTVTCSEMAEKILTEFLPYINKMKCNISSPSEMLIMKENLETMQEIKNEFQDFLRNWSIWKLKIGNQVADKISELLQRFATSYKCINEEDYEEQLEKLRTYLVTEGDKFCKRHNIKLCLHGITAVAGVAALPLAGVFAAAPAAAAAGTFTLESVGAWFGFQAAAPVAASAFSTSSIIGGATAAAQVGVAFVRRFI
ncbi:RING finger protein 112-like isoform X3 [Ranitomeya imitator]|uniref:RING finger protein 112-like isoform X3 n=1 Tax=Ranitomeya imitator TaxID=111125 RepID=UPI0037E72D43